jgi:hypothetical protein
MDKEMDKLLNPLSEGELTTLLKSWVSFKKNIINNPKLVLNINHDDIVKTMSILGMFDKELKKWRTPLIKKVYEISEYHFPFTDHRDMHVENLIRNNIIWQLERRNLRRIFGKSAEKKYPEYFNYETIKPK